MPIDRRLLLKGAALGAGALALPAWAQVMNARGFTHDVASGEPGPDRVMLWTRYVPEAGGSGRLRWDVASDAEFGRVVASGEVRASAERDWCVKPVAEGLAPGQWYFYRFRDEGGRTSAVGRTRTLPMGAVDRFNIAVFSCSNLPFGLFNAYAHAAGRRDIDLLLHVGDYLYEYERGKYPAPADVLPGRVIEPAHEMVALADYRMRYASYRLDPDLQRLHRSAPMVMMWDDHESANDSWATGAENHQAESEGDWQARKIAAMRACREWLPVSDENWTQYRIGQLADLFRPETRLVGRTRQLDLGDFLRGKLNIPAAITEFRDGPWRDEARTLLGMEQERWLADGLRRSVGDGVRWQVLGQQVVMGSLSLTPEIARFLGGEASPEARMRVQVGLAAAQAGLPFNFDQWDGYPAARMRLLRASLEADANLLVLSGDTHNAWAFDLDHEGTPAGAEFAVQSVTSPGYEAQLAGDPGDVARAILAGNRQLKWADTSRRGYLTLELTPERATGEWHFMETIRQPSIALSGRHRMTATHGSRRFMAA
ncbi:MAG: alkaline phosphatase [Sphingomonadales bacterium 12-68-11]|nr:MAG: alkaline phosphatase [Sphingomonadales bacterium 12-68-11]